MRTVFDEKDRVALLARLAKLKHDQAPGWGTLTAPKLVAHLGDQLRMALGDLVCEPVPSIWHHPIFRSVFLYTPGPARAKNQVGPPEAFSTPPTSWEADLQAVRTLMDRLVDKDPASQWPDHPNLGRMSRRAWGVFTYDHFDHHLRQFGV